jgi:hypothetical protein
MSGQRKGIKEEIALRKRLCHRGGGQTGVWQCQETIGEEARRLKRCEGNKRNHYSHTAISSEMLCWCFFSGEWYIYIVSIANWSYMRNTVSQQDTSATWGGVKWAGAEPWGRLAGSAHGDVLLALQAQSA